MEDYHLKENAERIEKEDQDRLWYEVIDIIESPEDALHATKTVIIELQESGFTLSKKETHE